MPTVGQIAVLVLAAAYVIFMSFGVHQVREGYVGVYWRGGALLNHISDPGYHVKMPFVTTMDEVQVTVQTDSVNNIPCGTSGGVLIHFDKIEVVNRLRKDLVYETVKNYTIHYDRTWIFEKIHHEINQFCSRHSLMEVYITKFDMLDEHLATSLQEGCRAWAPGIEIISVRVTKPIIPDGIRRNFEQMESEKAKLLIAEQAQKVAEKEAETEKRRRTIQAQAEADVARITAEKQVMEKEAAKRIALIQDQITLEKEKARADAEYYRLVKQAEANALLLTPEFLQYKNIMSLANNLKIYFGEKLPSVFLGYDPSKGPSKQALNALAAGAKLKSSDESLATEEVGTAAGGVSAANESGDDLAFVSAFTDLDGNTVLEE